MAPSVRRPSSAQPPDGFRWYAIKVHSGHEEVVKERLERRVRLEYLGDLVGRFFIPVERVAEIRCGRRAERTRKLFPGYLFCEVVPDERVLALVRATPGVTDFVGTGSVPVPLSPREAEQFVAGLSEGQVKVILPNLECGDRVRILRGTFAQTEGEVADILASTRQVRVRLAILGRPVLLDMEPADLLQLAGRG
jgi:transcriptional antiterminator NusG